MKKIILLIAPVFILTNCTKGIDKTNVIKSEAEKIIKENMNDLNSYEFVSFDKIDSINYYNNLKFQKENYDLLISSEETTYKNFKDLSITSAEENESRLQRIENLKLIRKKIDSLEIVLKDSLNNIASYTYLYKFRGNNKLGAKVLDEYVIQTNSKGDKIINITNEKDKVLLAPNDFPGYREIIK